MPDVFLNAPQPALWRPAGGLRSLLGRDGAVQIRSNMDICDGNADGEVQRQIDREVRMQEGASKLLAACSQREQALEASKSLLTCNARILALLSQLQRVKEAQVLQRMGHRSSDVNDRLPCTGKLAVSGLRIPLMWKDSEYFKNKGELHQCAVFCLLQCGKEIRDTNLVMVDRMLTDVCFEDTILFKEADPRFQLRVELYSSPLAEEPSSGPRRLSLLGGSLGGPSGRRIRAAFDAATACGSASADGDESHPRSPPPSTSSSSSSSSTLGPRYHLLAHTTLTMDHVQESFKTHDLSLTATEDSPFWLPLYGNMCCRLVAQPVCMTRPVVTGRLRVKSTADADRWEDIYGVLKGTGLLCYRRETDMQTDELPLFVIPVNKNTIVRVSKEEDESLQAQTLFLSTKGHCEDVEYTVAPHIPEDTQRWLVLCQQHLHDLSCWQRCCDDLMMIPEPPPRRPAPARRQQGSLYHEMVTPSAGEGHVVQDLSAEITELLVSYYQER
ncbi:Rhotekin [Merluccius polli]|uniref:Rhotekin n=1 Tax=Merluccius polli TaxID=89951 RepID=A0AA47NSV5_MERPO|nr:Rhotekin [Merluccius polli]